MRSATAGPHTGAGQPVSGEKSPAASGARLVDRSTVEGLRSRLSYQGIRLTKALLNAIVTLGLFPWDVHPNGEANNGQQHCNYEERSYAEHGHNKPHERGRQWAGRDEPDTVFISKLIFPVSEAHNNYGEVVTFV